MHVICFFNFRTRKDASLQVDQESPQWAASPGKASQLNTDGVLWLGKCWGWTLFLGEEWSPAIEILQN